MGDVYQPRGPRAWAAILPLPLFSRTHLDASPNLSVVQGPGTPYEVSIGIKLVSNHKALRRISGLNLGLNKPKWWEKNLMMLLKQKLCRKYFNEHYDSVQREKQKTE